MIEGRLPPTRNVHGPARFFSALAPRLFSASEQGRPISNIVENLRDLVLAPPLQRERFHVVFLDEHRQFLGSAAIGLGRIDSLSFSMRELFQRALAIEARAMVMAHSHLSGDCRPSHNDNEFTSRILEVANCLNIELIDHLIFTKSRVYSMRKGGLL